MTTRGSPWETPRPTSTLMALTTPPTEALSSFSIFMASSVTTPWPGLDLGPDLDGYPHHDTRHGRADGLARLLLARVSGGLCDPHGPLVHHGRVVVLSADDEFEPTVPAVRRHLVRPAVQHEGVDRRARDTHEVGGHGAVAERHLGRIARVPHLEVYVLIRDVDPVLHFVTLFGLAG